MLYFVALYSGGIKNHCNINVLVAFLLLIAAGWMTTAIDTFLRCFFLVIIWTATINLLIAHV